KKELGHVLPSEAGYWGTPPGEDRHSFSFRATGSRSADHFALAEQAHDEARHRHPQQVLRVAEVEPAKVLHLAEAIADRVDVDVEARRTRARVTPRRQGDLQRTRT